MKLALEENAQLALEYTDLQSTVLVAKQEAVDVLSEKNHVHRAFHYYTQVGSSFVVFTVDRLLCLHFVIVFHVIPYNFYSILFCCILLELPSGDLCFAWAVTLGWL